MFEVGMVFKLEVFSCRFFELGSVFVCYLGGVDSVFVLVMVHRVFGSRAIGMIVVLLSFFLFEFEEVLVFVMVRVEVFSSSSGRRFGEMVVMLIVCGLRILCVIVSTKVLLMLFE